nr:protein ABHD17B-like [Ipomoea trifida]
MSRRENSDAKWDDKKDMRKRRVKKVKESESANIMGVEIGGGRHRIIDEDGRLCFTSVTADKNVDVHYLLDTNGRNKIPSEFNTYYDIEAVYNCLKSEYEIKQEDVILIKTRTATALSLALPTNVQSCEGL